MKNLYTILAAGFLSLMIFASCRDHICRCHVAITGTVNETPVNQVTDTVLTFNGTGGEAKSGCMFYRDLTRRTLDEGMRTANENPNSHLQYSLECKMDD